jgi:hypothetical protein
LLKVFLLFENRQFGDYREIAEVNAPEQGCVPFAYFNCSRVFGDTSNKLNVKAEVHALFYFVEEYKIKTI